MPEGKTKSKKNNKPESFLKRLTKYQKERFPIIQYLIYILLYDLGFSILSSYLVNKYVSFSSINIIGFISVFLIFFELRLFDEIKDYDIDLKYSPQRPVQRGLISINEVKKMLLIVIILLLFCNTFYGIQNFVLMVIIQIYIIIMAKEFFIGKKLKKNRVLYAMLHMVVMSLMTLYIISHAVLVSMLNIRHLTLLAISYLIGFIIEVGRKIEAPKEEKPGVDNYSKLLGPKKAAYLLFFLTLLSSIFTFSIFIQLNNTAGIISLFSPLIVLIGVINFIMNMNKRNSAIMNFSGIIYNMLIFSIFISSYFWD